MLAEGLLLNQNEMIVQTSENVEKLKILYEKEKEQNFYQFKALEARLHSVEEELRLKRLGKCKCFFCGEKIGRAAISTVDNKTSDAFSMGVGTNNHQYK